MMDTRGMTEKGIKKKAAVQAIFTKLLYLSEVRRIPAGRKSFFTATLVATMLVFLEGLERRDLALFVRRLPSVYMGTTPIQNGNIEPVWF